ncbi:anion permease, partial [Lactiplantibacillus plantarum]|nr:anion permease [Lactiplantibacillus plantarum]
TSLNPLAVQASGQSVNFVSYFIYMGVPMIIAAILTMFLFLFLFKPSQEVHIDVEALKQQQAQLGGMTGKEVRTIIWLIIAIALWLTSGITGLDVGWLTLIVALMMSLPVVGGIL